MLAHNHLLFALGGYTFYSNQASNVFELLIGAIMAVLGSLLPDIDHPRSWIGHRLPGISSMVSRFFGHRNLLHSPIALVVICVSSWYLFQGSIFVFVGYAFCLGYFTHLFADWLTHRGIPIFWPVKKKYRALFSFRTGGIVEHGVTIVFVVMTMWSNWWWLT